MLEQYDSYIPLMYRGVRYDCMLLEAENVKDDYIQFCKFGIYAYSSLDFENNVYDRADELESSVFLATISGNFVFGKGTVCQSHSTDDLRNSSGEMSYVISVLSDNSFDLEINFFQITSFDYKTQYPCKHILAREQREEMSDLLRMLPDLLMKIYGVRPEMLITYPIPPKMACITPNVYTSYKVLKNDRLLWEEYLKAGFDEIGKSCVLYAMSDDIV